MGDAANSFFMRWEGFANNIRFKNMADYFEEILEQETILWVWRYLF